MILAQADQTNGAGWFNGNDAVVLRKGGRAGRSSTSSGRSASTPARSGARASTSTADNTLRRKGSIDAGDTNGSDAFDPLIEWNGFANDTFGGLGSHALGNEGVTATCGGALTTPEGTPATRSVSATDPDGRVIDIQITSVTPSRSRHDRARAASSRPVPRAALRPRTSTSTLPYQPAITRWS